jgi:hypothetical protein
MCFPLLLFPVFFVLEAVAVWLALQAISRKRFMLTRRWRLTGRAAVVAGRTCLVVAVVLFALVLTILYQHPD